MMANWYPMPMQLFFYRYLALKGIERESPKHCEHRSQQLLRIMATTWNKYDPLVIKKHPKRAVLASSIYLPSVIVCVD
jgi:hypothetical protein